MANEKENVVRNEKEVNIGELWYVFCKHILWEAVIFVVILGIGLAVALTSNEYYVARASVIVKASLNTSVDQSYNDTPLSQQQVVLVCDVLKNEFFLDRVQATVEGKTVSANKLTTSYNEDSLLINLTYQDSEPSLAKEKLTAIINEIAKFSKETNDDLLNKYFAADVEVVPITDAENKVNPRVSTRSDKVKIMVIAGVLGVVAVLVYAFCMLFFGDKVSSEEKLEKITGKKNFIVINEKKASRKSKKEKGISSNEFIEMRLDKLADSLIYLQDGEKNKVYQVQSTTSKEGKTTVAINLALTLGLSNRKTLVIDCDFSHPSIHRALQLSKKKGITDYFKGELDFNGMLKKTSNPNVDVITCGDTITDHTIFFTSDKFKSILAEAKQKYDFVILDCAPVKALSDYINVSPLVDATLLVVESDTISTRELTYVVNELNSCEANVVGTVLNFSSLPSQKKYYYYYHHKQADEQTEETQV